MRNKQRGFNLLVSVFISYVFLLFISTSNVKAQDVDATPVDDQGNTLSASVTGVSELPEVTVRGKGIDQAAAFDQMHDSLNKVNVLSQDQINQTPAKTVGQAIQQLPGVSVQHDEGEPQYAQIRGTDENLNILTFNNVIIPSFDPSLRAVQVDDIPVGIVSNIEVYKTIMPNMDGQGLGGQFNLVPKSAFDYAEPLYQLTTEMGYIPERNVATFAGDLNWADTLKLGGDAKLGLLVTAATDEKRFGIDDLEETYSTSIAGVTPESSKSIDQYSERWYQFDRIRGGIGANIDLSVDPNNKVFTNFMYGGYDEYRTPKLTTNLNNLDVIAANNDTVNPDGSFTINEPTSADDIETFRTYVLTQDRTLCVDAGGENKMNGIDMDYKAAYSYASQNEPMDYKWDFQSLKNKISGTVTYNNSTDDGDYPTINTSGLVGWNGNDMALKSVKDTLSDSTTSEYDLQANAKVNLDLGDDKGVLQLGARARLGDTAYEQDSMKGKLGAQLLLSAVPDDSGPYYNYPSDGYNMGPVVGYGVQQMMALNETSPYLTSWSEPDVQQDQAADWESWENIYAGYAMYTLTMGKLTAEAGARLEVTSIHYNWNLAVDDTDTDLAAGNTPETGTINYANILPNIGLKYTIDPTMTTRLWYSETIARPTYNQYVPAVGQGDTVPGTDPDSGFTIGNPNLLPMVSDNFDFSWEFYPEKAAIVGFDAFYKSIENYIIANYTLIDSTPGASEVTFSNVPSAQIWGVEFQYQQQYTTLPDFLSGLGLRGSISRMWSQGETSPGNYTELPSQSDLIWNAGIFYKKSGLTIDIGGSFTGANLSLIGNAALPGSQGGPVPNIYYDDYFQIDAKVQYAFTKDFTLYAEGDNLNNEPLRYYQGSSNLPIQNEYYGPTFDGGIDVTF